MGKLVESLVEGDIINLLQQGGIAVHDTSMRRKGKHGDSDFEFDIIAHNGQEIVIIEVKRTLRVNDVHHFIDKLTHAREWVDEYKSYNVYGAVAFLREESGAGRLAEKEMLFVVKATDNSAAIANRPAFSPRSF